MEQRVSVVTIGVRDISRSRHFYEQLGWRGQEVEETVFFQAGGQAVVLWSREKLAADSGVLDGGPCAFAGITLAHNLRSTEEVDDVLMRASAAGASVTREPADTFYGGYAGCFRDPDGHIWEAAFNPGFELDEAGRLFLPNRRCRLSKTEGPGVPATRIRDHPAAPDRRRLLSTERCAPPSDSWAVAAVPRALCRDISGRRSSGCETRRHQERLHVPVARYAPRPTPSSDAPSRRGQRSPRSMLSD